MPIFLAASCAAPFTDSAASLAFCEMVCADTRQTGSSDGGAHATCTRLAHALRLLAHLRGAALR